MALIYFMGPIFIRCNIYTVIFTFNFTKSRVIVLLVSITGFLLLIIIQSNCIGTFIFQLYCKCFSIYTDGQLVALLAIFRPWIHSFIRQ